MQITKPFQNMRRINLFGKDGRLDAIAAAIRQSLRPVELSVLSEMNNPGLFEKSEGRLSIGNTDNLSTIEEFALRTNPDWAIIGPEEPLRAGVVDKLMELEISCIGPTRSLARLETSKSFTRELLEEYNIPGNPDYRIFKSLDGMESYLRRKGEFVVKPDGLTGGKGVQVFGEHIHSVEDALLYCKKLFEVNPNRPVVIEEKLDGEEFTLQSFCDGRHVVDTIVVQDHKRAYDGDTGPNTGGMGSYSCEDHRLPFLSDDVIKEASKITSAVASALLDKCQQEYKGILYGGFMMTQGGLKLIEFNARFGDPEVMNVLPLLKTDFVDVCEAIINGTLDKISVEFEKKATVCKYVVPRGYPTQPEKEMRIDISDLPAPSDKLKIFYASVNKKPDGLYLTGSRAIALVGIGANLAEAEQIAEDAANRIKGPVRHRMDIGTQELIQKRINHMNHVFGKKHKLAVG